jgi:hypothetical protein
MTATAPMPTPYYWQHPLFWALVIIGMTIPFWVTVLPPLIDLPGHMARYHLMRELPNSPDLQRYYEYKWMLIGNLGVDLFVYALKGVLTVQQATWAACVITVMLTTLAIPLLSKTFHGEIQLSALAALPLVYAHFFFWGFLNYSLSVALALLAFVLWKKLENKTRLRAILFIPISCFVWLCHTIGWGILGVCILAVEIQQMRSRSHKLSLKMIPAIIVNMLPTVMPLFFIVYWRTKSGGQSFMYKTDFLSDKMSGLLLYLRGYNILLDLGYTAILMCLLYFMLRNHRLLLNRVLLLAAMSLSLVYAIMPTAVFGSYFADTRLVHVFMLLFVLSIFTPPHFSKRTKIITSFILVLIGTARLADITYAWHQNNRKIQNNLTALKYIKSGSRVLVFDLNSCARNWKIGDNYNHLDSLLVVTKNAFTNGHWKMLGAQPSTPIYNQDTLFGSDPSQYIWKDDCGAGEAASTEQAMTLFPRSRFDYVWVLRNSLHKMPPPADLEILYKDDQTALYAVRPGQSNPSQK